MADLNTASYYQWWVSNTSPKHPVLADTKHELFKQLGAKDEWPEVFVVDCRGDIKYHRQGAMDESSYLEVKDLVQKCSQDIACVNFVIE